MILIRQQQKSSILTEISGDRSCDRSTRAQFALLTGRVPHFLAVWRLHIMSSCGGDSLCKPSAISAAPLSLWIKSLVFYYIVIETLAIN